MIKRMFHHRIFVLAALLLAGINLNAQFMLSPDTTYAQAWQAIDSLEGRGQYRTALEETENLYARAKADGEQAQEVKALLYRLGYVQELNEDGQIVAIQNLEEAYQRAETPVKPVLASLLGSWYYGYWESNRWQINQRTPLAEDPGIDLTQWTAADFIRRSTELMLVSAEDTETRLVDLTDFGILLTKGENTDGLWPTLYDFLVHRAIEHFDRADAFLAEPNYQAALDGDYLFAPLRDFLSAEIPTAERVSSTARALQLYQRALAWHVRQGGPDVLFDLNLQRLQFAHRFSQQSDKDERLAAALDRLRTTEAGTPREARVIYAQMELRWEQGNQYQEDGPEALRWAWRDALQLNDQLQSRFAASIPAQQGASLAARIRQPELNAQVEAVNLPGEHGLASLRYRNVPQAFFRIVEISENDYLNQLDEENFLRSLLRRRAQQSWSEELPAPGDYREHRTETSFRPLPGGVYVLLMSNHEDFSTQGGVVHYLPF
ncbi:MAG: hypothetical protein KDC54_00295, partial [Lewinella sp.]|nr:hypothetical protein [Lewinella sp.]